MARFGWPVPWARTASATKRAEAAEALARSWRAGGLTYRLLLSQTRRPDQSARERHPSSLGTPGTARARLIDQI